MPGSQQSLGIISTVLKQQLRAAHTIHAAYITHATIIIWWSVPTLPGVCVSNSTNGCWDKLHLFFTCFEVVVVNFSQGKRDYCKHCFMIEWCKKLAKVNNDVNNCLKLLCHQKYIAGVVEKVRVIMLSSFHHVPHQKSLYHYHHHGHNDHYHLIILSASSYHYHHHLIIWSSYHQKSLVVHSPSSSTPQATSSDRPRRTVTIINLNDHDCHHYRCHHSHHPSYYHQCHQGDEGFEDVSDSRGCVHCVLDSIHSHGNMVSPLSQSSTWKKTHVAPG